MKNSDRDHFDGRMKSASEANQSKLERFKAAADDPERLAKRAQRDEAAVAREAKRQAKAAELLQEKEGLERQRAEDTKREQEEVAVREAAHAETAEQVIEQTAAHEAERKAERDRRYAARQNRKR